MFWEPFGRLLGGSWGALGSPKGSPVSPLGSLGSLLVCPGRLLGGLCVSLAVLGVSRESFGVSWGCFWGAQAAKRYQHDAKMDIQSSTALKKARFPFYECTGSARGPFLLLFAVLSRGQLKIRGHLSGRVS